MEKSLTVTTGALFFDMDSFRIFSDVALFRGKILIVENFGLIVN